MQIVIVTNDPMLEVVADRETKVVIVRKDDPLCVDFVDATVDSERVTEYMYDAYETHSLLDDDGMGDGFSF